MHAQMQRPGRYDESSVADSTRSLMESGGVFVSERGMIGGFLMPAFWSRHYRSAAEVFWWAEDGQAMVLLDAFEGWARGHGAQEVFIGTQAAYRGAAVGRLLQRKGYAMSETYWVKGLNDG